HSCPESQSEVWAHSTQTWSAGSQIPREPVQSRLFLQGGCEVTPPAPPFPPAFDPPVGFPPVAPASVVPVAPPEPRAADFRPAESSLPHPARRERATNQHGERTTPSIR